MAYRAPELFDVKTGITVDEKVDIWVRDVSLLWQSEPRSHNAYQSLGCTLFALAYSHSPFENTQTTEQGGSIAMAVMNAQYKHPGSAYSQGLRDLIDSMLKVNPKDRPDIHEVHRYYTNPGFPFLIIESPTGHPQDGPGSPEPPVIGHSNLSMLHSWLPRAILLTTCIYSLVLLDL